MIYHSSSEWKLPSAPIYAFLHLTMISLTTAKLLLFIALCLGPKCSDNNHTIEIVSKNSYIVWTETSGGWTLDQKGMASDTWPATEIYLTTDQINQFGKTNKEKIHVIAHHNWDHNSTLYFEDGDVLQKQGSNKVFYTINAGGYNQQIFTIQTVKDGNP